ncbi:sugar transferase [Halomonas sp. CKK8]|uniref:sugar transferase n=1 Tax=Halomonas sp. CKK8 TaxID=3036127 RepID=UPI0024155867|nr:sugar transferase [Halomonas sp. CKK8]WFM70009.1 sugar transferase [Halomonas sp. CKK8]
MDTITSSSALPGQRRHSRFLERLLLSRAVQRLLGFGFAVLLPTLAASGGTVWETSELTRAVTVLIIALAYWGSLTCVQRMSRLPGVRAYLLSIPAASACFGIPFLLLYITGIELIAELYLASYLLTSLYCTAGYWVGRHYRVHKLAVVPFGKATSLCHNHGVDWRYLETPDLGEARVDGVVADLRAEFSPEWERFLAHCTLNRIPVYHATTNFERLTGRVQLGHLYENRYGSLQPDEGYEALKRSLDVLAVLALMPVALPLMAITALAIRLDSPGPALFTQQRMGFQCRPFVVYKFRSMFIDHRGTGFTQDGEDPRITRVGKVIRKYRLDELPQLFNVLKGDMSLIGPRPESMDLADWYQKDVPFFHYRHVVRPGISGWAQVEQGYAAEVDGMNKKLEYDFYYIKNISLWLDLLIVLRTIKTVLTGFGSR